jgi:hypothetical protein
LIQLKKKGKRTKKKEKRRGGRGLGNYLVQVFVGNHEALDIEVRNLLRIGVSMLNREIHKASHPLRY